MVDFNSEATMSRSAEEVRSMIILQKQEKLSLAIEDYDRKTAGGGAVPTNYIQARLKALYHTIRPMLRRHWDDETHERFHKLSASKQYTELLGACQLLDEFLDDLGLTRIDNRQKLGGNLKERNKAQGWGS